MLQLYKNIKARRLDLGMSQTELAKKCGYTDRSSIAKVESGQVDLPQSKIKVFADALGVSMSDLMGTIDDNMDHDILDDIDIAFYGDYKELTDDDKETIRQMARVMRERHKKK